MSARKKIAVRERIRVREIARPDANQIGSIDDRIRSERTLILSGRRTIRRDAGRRNLERDTAGVSALGCEGNTSEDFNQSDCNGR